jgi:hypothetical protein
MIRKGGRKAGVRSRKLDWCLRKLKSTRLECTLRKMINYLVKFQCYSSKIVIISEKFEGESTKYQQ